MNTKTYFVGGLRRCLHGQPVQPWVLATTEAGQLVYHQTPIAAKHEAACSLKVAIEYDRAIKAFSVGSKAFLAAHLATFHKPFGGLPAALS